MQRRVQKRLGFNFPASVVVTISTSTQQFQNLSICKTSKVKQSRIKSDNSWDSLSAITSSYKDEL